MTATQDSDRAFALPMSRFQRVSCEDFWGKPNPHFAMCVHVARDGNARGLECLVAPASGSKASKTVLAKSTVCAAARARRAAATAVHFAGLDRSGIKGHSDLKGKWCSELNGHYAATGSAGAVQAFGSFSHLCRPSHFDAQFAIDSMASAKPYQYLRGVWWRGTSTPVILLDAAKFQLREAGPGQRF